MQRLRSNLELNFESSANSLRAKTLDMQHSNYSDRNSLSKTNSSSDFVEQLNTSQHAHQTLDIRPYSATQRSQPKKKIKIRIPKNTQDSDERHSRDNSNED